MLGLLGIGVTLIAGVAMRIAAGAAALMLVLMWTAVLPIENNPVIDDHLVYALVAIGLAAAGAGRTYGFGRGGSGSRSWSGSRSCGDGNRPDSVAPVLCGGPGPLGLLPRRTGSGPCSGSFDSGPLPS